MKVHVICDAVDVPRMLSNVMMTTTTTTMSSNAKSQWLSFASITHDLLVFVLCTICAGLESWFLAQVSMQDAERVSEREREREE